MVDPRWFTVAVLGLLVMPGPTNTLLATAGSVLGFRRALRLLPAELVGYLIAISVYAFVIQRVVATNPELARWLRFSTVVVLLVLAVRLWRSSTRIAAEATAARPVLRPVHVFVTTLANPKALVFAFHIMPHLADGQFQRALPYLTAFAAMVVTVAVGWVRLGASLHESTHPLLKPATIRRASAIVLSGFAVAIAGTG